MQTKFNKVRDKPAISLAVLCCALLFAATISSRASGPPPTISVQPANQTVPNGGGVTFSVTASGNGSALSYQWFFGGVNIVGATNGTFALSNLNYTNAGTYFVTVTNAGGGLLSSNATLIVTVPAGADQPLAQGLVAHLTFDGNLQDSSGRGNQHS